MAWGLANEARCVGDFSGSILQVKMPCLKHLVSALGCFDLANAFRSGCPQLLNS